MKVVQERIAGVLTIELRSFVDERGFFLERFSTRAFRAAGIPTEFCQDNHSRSKPGVLRGLHYQSDPGQGKLIGVVRGRIWDVALDVRPHSPTFGEHFDIELDGDTGRMLWLPAGIAHGFCVLGDEPADVVYKVDQPYNSQSEGGILWCDAALKIKWPVTNPIVSARDRTLPTFAEYSRRPPIWPRVG